VVGLSDAADFGTIYENKRVLITGGSGFIGSALSEFLLKLGAEVVVYDVFNSFYPGKRKNIEDIESNSKFTLIQGDILNYSNLCCAMKGINLVFHLAAQPGVRYSLLNPVETNSVNTSGTLNVLATALKYRVDRVVNISSSSVYGDQTKLPMKESGQLSPISPYGISKLTAEQYCNFYHTTFGLNVVTLRYFTVYGPRQRPDMAISKFVKKILEQKTITIYGDGLQTRDFTYITDILNGTVSSGIIEDIEGQVFNLGSGKSVSIKTLCNILCSILSDFNITYDDKKEGDVSHTLADISKAMKYLHYSPKTTLKEGLLRYIDWYKQKCYYKK